MTDVREWGEVGEWFHCSGDIIFLGKRWCIVGLPVCEWRELFSYVKVLICQSVTNYTSSDEQTEKMGIKNPKMIKRMTPIFFTVHPCLTSSIGILQMKEPPFCIPPFSSPFHHLPSCNFSYYCIFLFFFIWRLLPLFRITESWNRRWEGQFCGGSCEK